MASVVSPKKSVCLGDRPVVVSQPAGVLASLVSAETGCGTANAPWRIQVLPGQRINVTLVDFSWAVVVGTLSTSYSGTRFATAASPSAVATASSSVAAAAAVPLFPVDCRVYAVVRETPEAAGVTVCGGETRAKTVYVSRSNRVDVQLINVVGGQHQSSTKTNYAFAFVYEGNSNTCEKI